MICLDIIFKFCYYWDCWLKWMTIFLTDLLMWIDRDWSKKKRGTVMFNFSNRRNQKTITRIIVALLIIAMAAGLLISSI